MKLSDFAYLPDYYTKNLEDLKNTARPIYWMTKETERGFPKCTGIHLFYRCCSRGRH